MRRSHSNVSFRSRRCKFSGSNTQSLCTGLLRRWSLHNISLQQCLYRSTELGPWNRFVVWTVSIVVFGLWNVFIRKSCMARRRWVAAWLLSQKRGPRCSMLHTGPVSRWCGCWWCFGSHCENFRRVYLTVQRIFQVYRPNALVVCIQKCRVIIECIHEQHWRWSSAVAHRL